MVLASLLQRPLTHFWSPPRYGPPARPGPYHPVSPCSALVPTGSTPVRQAVLQIIDGLDPSHFQVETLLMGFLDLFCICLFS